MYALTIYTTGPACQRCTLTKRQADKLGITWTEVDLRENDAAREYVTDDLGYSEAPVVVVEDDTGTDHWSGFRPDHLKRIATH